MHFCLCCGVEELQAHGREVLLLFLKPFEYSLPFFHSKFFYMYSLHGHYFISCMNPLSPLPYLCKRYPCRYLDSTSATLYALMR